MDNLLLERKDSPAEKQRAHHDNQQEQRHLLICVLAATHFSTRSLFGSAQSMKVFLYYEDNASEDLHKTLKITLPKSWKLGPVSKLLAQFVESYNSNEKLGSTNQLSQKSMHLATRNQGKLVDLPLDAVLSEVVPDRADVYVMHGPSKTVREVEAEKRAKTEKDAKALKSTVACTHFGCKNRFPREGPFPQCRYHKSPPVFHETAKFWSCCPDKKAYDWESFENIPGCQTGECTAEKNAGSKKFLGGADLRAKVEPTQLKSIDDFNAVQAAGGATAAPVLERLGNVLEELGIDRSVFEHAIDRIKTRKTSSMSDSSKADVLEAVKEEMKILLEKSFLGDC